MIGWHDLRRGDVLLFDNGSVVLVIGVQPFTMNTGREWLSVKWLRLDSGHVGSWSVTPAMRANEMLDGVVEHITSARAT